MTSTKREEFQKRFEYAAAGLKGLGFVGEIYVDGDAVMLVGHNKLSAKLLRQAHKGSKAEVKDASVFYSPRKCEKSFLICFLSLQDDINRAAKASAAAFMKAA